MQVLTVLLVLVAIVAIFATTPAGKRIAAEFGLNFSRKGRAPQEDHDYLLRVCNGDFDELGNRLSAVRRNNHIRGCGAPQADRDAPGGEFIPASGGRGRSTRTVAPLAR